MKKISKKLIEKWIALIERFFFAGLLAILPITLTIFIINFTVNLFRRWLGPLLDYLPATLQHIPYSEFIFALLIVLITGAIIDVLVLDRIVHALEKLVSKIPFINPIYTGLKQLISAFAKNDKTTINQVVLLEFPRTGIYSVGFVTGEITSPIFLEKNADLVSVFIPTTPNPTTGYYVMVKKSELDYVNLTKQEAMALIISGGIIQPKNPKS
jgi:uncharacterized membrane protein